MDEYVKEHGFAGWFETSAKENINIDEAARALVNKVKGRFLALSLSQNMHPYFQSRIFLTDIT